MSEAVRPSWWRRARHSLRVRLVLLFLLLAVAMSAAFLGGIGRAFSVGWRGAVDPRVGDYADRLAAEIGAPPSVERAQAIAARLPVAVRIEGPRVNWQSAPLPEHGPPWARERGGWEIRTYKGLPELFLELRAGRIQAMIADAVHSISDLATDVIVLIFARISSKPEDAGHNYGHGKYETLASILISLTLIAVGGGILADSIRNRVEAAYRRGDLFGKRLPLMQEWAEFVLRQEPSPHVVSNRGGDRLAT